MNNLIISVSYDLGSMSELQMIRTLPVTAITGHLEQAGAKIAGDPIVGNRVFQALVEHSMVEAGAAAGMSSEHYL